MEKEISGRFLTLREVAARLRLSPQTFYNCLWRAEGVLAELPYFRFGRTVRFLEADVERFIAAHRVEPGRLPDQPGRRGNRGVGGGNEAGSSRGVGR